jgi:hypothetical protein
MKDKIVNASLVFAVIGAFAFCSAAEAQVWNENNLAWDAPTTCTSGQPITACPITNYRVERSATTDGGYAALGTSISLNFRHIGAVEGRNCYRVVAVSPVGESVPSVVACKTNVAPSGPPNPPTNPRFVTLAVVNAGAPTFGVLGTTLATFRVGEFYGLVPAGRPCGDYLVTFRGQRLHRVIPERGETWGDFGSRPLAAPCGPSA